MQHVVKKDFVVSIKLKILQCEDHLGSSNIITKILKRGRSEDQQGKRWEQGPWLERLEKSVV